MLPHLKGNRFAHLQGDSNKTNPFANPNNTTENAYDNMNPYSTVTKESYSQPESSLNYNQNNYGNPNLIGTTKGPTDRLISSNYTTTSNGVSGSMNSNVYKAQNASQTRNTKDSKVDSDKIPRPLIYQKFSVAPKQFVTAEGAVPPSSTQSFITVDNGVAGPRYIRSSYYTIPSEPSTLNTVGVPLGIILQPLAEPTQEEEGVPIIDYTDQGGLFRCTRCKAYVNPHFVWTDGGRLAICNICKMQNKVPSNYYVGTNEYGQRRDKGERYELCKGVYEFVAPADYHNRKLVTPYIAICIDAGPASYSNGIFNQVLSSIESLLDYIPSPELTNIAIFTFDQSITYFQAPQDLSKELKVTAVNDIDDYCVPFPPSVLFTNIAEQKERLVYLIQKIQKYYDTFYQTQTQQKTFTPGTCFGAALNNCGKMLKDQGGRVLIFTTSGPTVGLGKIKRRDDYKLMNTEKEKTLFVPQCEEYDQFAKEFLESRVCVDLFVFSPEYFDFATIGAVANNTGGNLYYYPYYNPTFDSEKLHYDIARNLTRYCGYDAVMNVRASTGISFSEYITPMGRRPQPILELSALDADSTINVLLKMDEKVVDEVAHLQTAVLYTNPYGQRVIRVINLALKVSNDVGTIFKGLDVETVALLLLRKNIITINNLTVKQIRETLLTQLVHIFHSYRTNCAGGSPMEQLILPEALKVLPCYFLSSLKTHILRSTNDVKPDERSYDLHKLIKMPINCASNFLYPKVFQIHTICDVGEPGPGQTTEEGRIIMPVNIPTTQDKLTDDGIYLIDNSESICLYVRNQADTNLLMRLFGQGTVDEIINSVFGLQPLEDDYNTRVLNIVEQLRKNKNAAYQNLRVVAQGDPYEPYLLTNFFIEDSSKYGENLSDFVCHIHKLIQQKMSS